MKWIILILLVFILAVLISTRYRTQINAAIILWRTLTKGNSSASQIRSRAKAGADSKSVELIKCAKCGSWTPETNTLALNSGELFCSTTCINEAILIKKQSKI
jgi:hypothetical protein